VYDEIKQKARPSSPALDSLTRWMDTAFAGALRGDFGPHLADPITPGRVSSNRWRLSDRHNLSLKYNHTWSKQETERSTSTHGRAAPNGLEKDYSNAVNGSLVSYLSSRTSNDSGSSTRGKIGRGPIRARRRRCSARTPPNGAPAVPGRRYGLWERLPVRHAVLLPIDYYDTRIQILDKHFLQRAATTFFKLGAGGTA